jgi:hypothetical protein
MRLNITCFTTILIFYIGISGLKAQETITISGGNTTGGGGSVSYTIGQIVYTTNTGTNGSVAQGVQQPFEISVVIGIDEAKDIQLECSVYPNPTLGLLKLKVENIKLTDLRYQLFDMNGRLLQSQNIEKAETEITIENLVATTYFLKITAGSKKEVKTFKIIKY